MALHRGLHALDVGGLAMSIDPAILLHTRWVNMLRRVFVVTLLFTYDCRRSRMPAVPIPPACDVVVLGAGMAGLGACQALHDAGASYVGLERHTTVGGHARSHRARGFTFDEGPHISFSNDHAFTTRLRQALDNQVVDGRATIMNYWKGHWIPHPAQLHLHALPQALREQVLLELRQRPAQPSEVANYNDWLREAFGPTFSATFASAYTRKYWTVQPQELTVDWLGTRVIRPTLADVEHGAAPGRDEEVAHYIQSFRYPMGGFGCLPLALGANLHMHTGINVVAIDLDARTLTCQGGHVLGFKRLINTAPLPELVAMTNAPAMMQDHACQLRCTSVMLVNLELHAERDFPGGHWFYVYDEDKRSCRVSYPHRFSPNNVPPGRASIQVEVYVGEYRSADDNALADTVVAELVAMGVLHGPTEVTHAQTQFVRYANVLFDHARAHALNHIAPWLAQYGIELAGRYGAWQYYWTDQSWQSGVDAARRCLAGEAAITRP